jgi:hypothetical protein
MKDYWSIPGIKDCPKGLPCLAFEKFDGSNVRFEWTKKRGWYKFGTRNRLFDASDPEFGGAIAVFLQKYGDAVPKVLHDEKEYRGVQDCIVFGEWFGEHSFAAYQDWSEPHDVVLFDVNPHKKGIISPRQFVKHFGHLHIPQVVYEGNFNQQFIRDVREGKYPVKEGVVAKGLRPGGKPPHNLWMAKCKTLWWLQELRRRAAEGGFQQILMENEAEQSYDLSETC